MKRVDFQLLSGPELVKLYNEVTGEGVKRFSTHSAGVRRVAALFPKNGGVSASETNENAPTLPKQHVEHAQQTAAAFEAAGRKPRSSAAVLSYNANPHGKSPRPTSKRGRLLSLLQKSNGRVLSAGLKNPRTREATP